MKTSELFNNKRVLSFEIFPPKRTSGIETIYSAVNELKTLSPDFISVTYGAGGSDTNENTLKIASAVKNDYGVLSVAHLPSVNLDKNDVLLLLGELKSAGIENILALRGDINPDYPPKNCFKYASDLISFIKENGDFNIIAACYPEGHYESKNLVNDIRNLKIKVDSGADHLITQLFFDNNYFYSFRERAAIAGIDVPIQAGIMPVVNKKQIERMVTLCKVDLPKKFLSFMNRYEHNEAAMRAAGIAYDVDQIVDLLSEGVDVIHLYTMNNPYIVLRFYEAGASLMN